MTCKVSPSGEAMGVGILSKAAAACAPVRCGVEEGSDGASLQSLTLSHDTDTLWRTLRYTAPRESMPTAALGTDC
jgi:hypothetical protein